MAPWGWQEIIGTIGVFVLLTVVITVVIWQVATSWRAKAALAQQASYRTLAQAAVTTQQNIDKQLSDVASRLASVERMLKEIE